MQIGTSRVGNKRILAGTSPMIWALRWRAAQQIAKQELRDALVSWAFYVTATIGPLLGSIFVYNSVNFVAESGLQILSRPFLLPTLITTSLATLFIAAWATLAIARPRDQGALRVLFFAPVDAFGVIGGHILAGTAIFALLMLISTPILLVFALLTNVPLPLVMLVGFLVSPLFAAVAISIGLFISTIAASSRSAMFFFGATLMIILAVPLGYNALLGIPPTGRYYDALLFVRELVRGLRDLLNWISPYSLMSDSIDAARRANWIDLVQHMLAGVVGCVAWGALAIWGLRNRGVLP